METSAWSSAVDDKIRELCQALLDGPWLQSIRDRIDAFERDADAQVRMQAVNDKGELLRHKQMQGVAITPSEIEEFEQLRDVFLESSTARGFVEAQDEMHDMKSSVELHLTKTLELGRVPRPEDLQHGCGSGGCGCSH